MNAILQYQSSTECCLNLLCDFHAIETYIELSYILKTMLELYLDYLQFNPIIQYSFPFSHFYN